MKKQDKCCGSCGKFTCEDMDGYGVCEIYDIVAHCTWTNISYKDKLNKNCRYWEKKEQNHDL